MPVSRRTREIHESPLPVRICLEAAVELAGDQRRIGSYATDCEAAESSLRPISEQSVLAVAGRIYGSRGPAFNGLRTTLGTYILLVLLRIPRPEALKEYAPGDPGHIVGLDRLPEVNTLPRKLARLASRKASQEFGRELARRRITRDSQGCQEF
jgi:hypothetical protein